MEEIAGFVRTVKYLEIKTIRITHKRPFSFEFSVYQNQ